ncbi:hypothetical protein NQ317_002806 [Molorchus minor]|uniref:Cation efflux protein transmembrane domain-containing protein n=1 Tax=Molorchus minor TaxID=1323400 RepID=A0ABQ9JPM5_9CUCU|nr:hypothetical protein NQ317_002806 [Molorchus minor]
MHTVSPAKLNLPNSLEKFSDNTGRNRTQVFQSKIFHHELGYIIDCYSEPSDSDFHCHQSLVTTGDSKAWKKLVVATVLCTLFMIAELLGGYFAGSLAIMTDAAHLFSDFVGFIISLIAIWVGKKPPTKTMTFGYHRAEVIGALLSVLTIWILAGVFVVLSINRIYNDDYEINADTMIIVASLGVVVNIILGVVLHGTCSKHSHGLNQQHSHASSDNINVRAAAVHVLGDLLQSLGVLVAALVIKFFPNAKIADPICTLLFSVIVLFTTFKVGKDSIWFLIEGSPISSTKLMTELGRLGSVKHVHNVHIWSLAPGKGCCSCSSCHRCCDRDTLLKKASSLVHSYVNTLSCTIQIEIYNPELINQCRQCQSMSIQC